jgi:hypothetical protein
VATVAPPRSSEPRSAEKRPRIGAVQNPVTMEVSSYERVSSMLVALLMIFGFIVLLMLLIWFSSQFSFKRPVVDVTMVEDLGGGGKGNSAPNSEQTLDEVMPDEVQEIQEVNVEKTLSEVATAVSAQTMTLDMLPGKTGFGNGQGNGMGDGRGPGPGGPGTAKELPAWEVRFSATTLDMYAQQLDFFGIELGVAGGGKTTVDYALHLSRARPTVRTADGGKEGRRYLLWRKGPLASADKELLKKANIDTQGRIVMQFVPEPTEKMMATLEAQHAKGRKLHEIRRTVFGIRGTPGKYEFYVLEQDYRGV